MPEFDPTQVQYRALAIRDVNAETREFTGIGVPFGEVYDSGWGFREEFDPACVFDNIDRAKLLARHQTVVGTIPSTSHDADALRVTGRFSRTAAGDDEYTLVKDGAVDALSIGFDPVEYLTLEDGTIRHTRVWVREFSTTPYPAYKTALVEQVRERPNHPERNAGMTESDTLTRADMDLEFQTRDAELTRSFEALVAQLREGQQKNTAGPVVGTQWRSAGEFLRAVSSGNAEALAFHRDYVGGKFVDTATPATWITDAIKLVEERRPILNTFSRAALPPKGETLTYRQLDQNTAAIAKQAAEGDTLAFGKVTLKTATATVDTYGGYTGVSRQTVERGEGPVLDTTLRAMDIQYAKATESAVKTRFTSLLATQITAGNKVTLAAAAEVYDWLDILVDAFDIADTRGFLIEGALVSKTAFKRLLRLEDNSGRSLMTVQGTGVNQVGTLNIAGLSASLSNVQLRMIPGTAGQVGGFYDSVAITSWESPGAPVQLGPDEDITNLTTEYSKYGYLATGSQFPTALIPIEFTA